MLRNKIFAKSKLEPDAKIARPATRGEKLAVIRDVFAEQGKYVVRGEIHRGYSAREQNDYLVNIGLEPTEKNKARSDEEIDLILADMDRHRMVLFK